MMHPTTKILATLGPASEAPHRVKALISAGASAFRMNYSHGEHEEHLGRLTTVREVASEMGRHVPIVSDMQGPKLRVGKIAGEALKLGFGDEVEALLGETAPEGTLPVPHEELFEALKAGDELMIDDGAIRLSVIEGGSAKMVLKTEVPGTVTNRKGINVPGRRLRIDALTDKDRSDLAFALEHNTDYVALSFVQCAEDVQAAREIIGTRSRIISKIEKPSALEDLEGIVEASDGVMVARGDLGVELPLEQVPPAQRRIISMARERGKLVIVATQMLQSMVDAPIPTRAEASDTATAVYLGADAVMLSAESAVGRHPEAAVAIMTRIIRAVSEDPNSFAEIAAACPDPFMNAVGGATAVAAADAADLVDATAIVAATNSGSTAYLISQLRPEQPIIALTPHELTARQVALAWGVTPKIIKDTEDFEELTRFAAEASSEFTGAQSENLAILLAGLPPGRVGSTNTMKIFRIGDYK
ncbi:pyruvate kinase [Parvularcula marina]|uniref:pyruvate kinase n=1 Tax=Parvularcula marina TaxID=2292771 RepID=UPI003516D2DA